MRETNPSNEFDFKLRLLEKELEAIDKIIDRLDNICQNIKYWTIIIFLGVSSAILSSKVPDIKRFIILTPFIPILFWIVDTNWRMLQYRAMKRSRKISEFINSTEFTKCCEQKNLNTFFIWDEMSTKDDKEKKNEILTSFRQVFWFKTIYEYYIGLILLGIIMSILASLLM